MKNFLLGLSVVFALSVGAYYIARNDRGYYYENENTKLKEQLKNTDDDFHQRYKDQANASRDEKERIKSDLVKLYPNLKDSILEIFKPSVPTTQPTTQP